MGRSLCRQIEWYCRSTLTEPRLANRLLILANCASVVCIGGSSAWAAPGVDSLLCKRQQDVVDLSPTGEEKHSTKAVLDVRGDQRPSAVSPDGAHKLARLPDKANDSFFDGFAVIDVATGKVHEVHNRDREYDCDMPVNDGVGPSSVRWLGNDVVFAQGWYCSEFAAKPYLASAKTGKFIGYVKLNVTPEAVYSIAHVDGSRWAVSVYDHNTSLNSVVVVDTKTGKIVATKKASAAQLAKVPDCP